MSQPFLEQDLVVLSKIWGCSPAVVETKILRQASGFTAAKINLMLVLFYK
jgi:hypothetical protein